ncbi:MAG: M23 family metallopeptidase [Myxococcales bacterium]|nr:M23 family metallopeptidase [Myxococcales bacterium]
MIMPESSSAEVRRLRVPRSVLGAALLSSFLILAGALVAALYGVHLLRSSGQADVLATENRALREELHVLDQRLTQAHEVVRSLHDYEQKLRSLTMVNDPARNLAIGPVGPDSSEDQVETIQSAQLRKALLSGGSVDDSIALMEARVAHLEQESTGIRDRVRDLSAFLSGQEARLASTPSRRPSPGYVSSTFGMRVDPFTGLPQFHAGLDFASNIGAPVTAPADGVVVLAGPFGAFGNTVQLDHGFGLSTVYGHMSRVDVRAGERVRRGDRIGAVGNSGRSTGPHLHYEVRLNGIPQDPSRFVLD